MDRELTELDDEILANKRLVGWVLKEKWGGVHDPAEREDLEGAGLIGLAEGLRSVGARRGEHRTNYLRRLIHVEMLDYWRDVHGRPDRLKSPRPVRADVDVETMLSEPGIGPGIAADAREVVIGALRRMRPKQRECALLVWGVGLSCDDAARVLRCSANNVAQHLMRARWAARREWARFDAKV